MTTPPTDPRDPEGGAQPPWSQPSPVPGQFPAQPPAQPPSQPPVPPYGAPMQPPGQPPAQPPSQPPSQPPVWSPPTGAPEPKRRGGLIALIIAIVVVLVGGGVAVAMLLHNNDDDKPAAVPAVSSQASVAPAEPSTGSTLTIPSPTGEAPLVDTSPVESSPDEPSAPAGSSALTMPDTAGGLPKSDLAAAGMGSQLDQLKGSLTGMGVDVEIGMYGSASSGMAVSMAVKSPMAAGMGDAILSAWGVNSPTDVGGGYKCGSGTSGAACEKVSGDLLIATMMIGGSTDKAKAVTGDILAAN